MRGKTTDQLFEWRGMGKRHRTLQKIKRKKILIALVENLPTISRLLFLLGGGVGWWGVGQ